MTNTSIRYSPSWWNAYWHLSFYILQYLYIITVHIMHLNNHNFIFMYLYNILPYVTFCYIWMLMQRRTKRWGRFRVVGACTRSDLANRQFSSWLRQPFAFPVGAAFITRWQRRCILRVHSCIREHVRFDRVMLGSNSLVPVIYAERDWRLIAHWLANVSSRGLIPREIGTSSFIIYSITIPRQS